MHEHGTASAGLGMIALCTVQCWCLLGLDKRKENDTFGGRKRKCGYPTTLHHPCLPSPYRSTFNTHPSSLLLSSSQPPPSLLLNSSQPPPCVLLSSSTLPPPPSELLDASSLPPSAPPPCCLLSSSLRPAPGTRACALRLDLGPAPGTRACTFSWNFFMNNTRQFSLCRIRTVYVRANHP